MSFKSRAFASALRHTVGRRRSRRSSFVTPISPASAALKLARRLVGPPPSKAAGKRAKTKRPDDTAGAQVGHEHIRIPLPVTTNMPDGSSTTVEHYIDIEIPS